MIRALLPPFALLAIVSMLAMPMPTRAAEPLLVFTPPPIEAEPTTSIMRFFAPRAAFVGRTPAGMGYVLVSPTRGYFNRPQPGGVARVIPADPNAVKDLVRLSGWIL